MFLDLLHEEGGGEEWRSYRAFKGELPTPEQLASCRGVVITGSM